MEDVTREQFLSTVYPMRLPVILRGADLGDCRQKWTPEAPDVVIVTCAHKAAENASRCIAENANE